MRNAIVFNDTSTHPHHGCQQVMQNLYSMLAKLNIRVIGKSYVDTEWSTDEKLLASIEEADILIINGEGTIHHDAMAGAELLKVGLYARSLGKKSILINCTYQNNSPENKRLLEAFDLISVRESWSQKELDKIDVESVLVPDLVFYEWLDNQDVPREGLAFTCSVSRSLTAKMMSRFKGGSIYLPIISAQLPVQHKSTGSTAVRKSVKTPLVKKLKNLFLVLIARCLKWRFKTRRFKTAELYAAEIGKVEFLTVARFHALCFAIMKMTPFLALSSNTFKMEAVLSDIGIAENRVVNRVKDIQSQAKSPLSQAERDSIRRYQGFAKERFRLLEKKITQIVDAE